MIQKVRGLLYINNVTIVPVRILINSHRILVRDH